jgi:CubicO group peptidase (beta-lactamase class C family)
MKHVLLCAFFVFAVSPLVLLANDVVQAPTASAPTTEETPAQDTPQTTFDGHSFVAPAGWSVRRLNSATILTAPEGGSQIALVDVAANDADAAVIAAWTRYDANAKHTLADSGNRPLRNGWEAIRGYRYDTGANEKRVISAVARRHGQRWTVSIRDMDVGIDNKRSSQVELIHASLLPKGYRAETFADRRARKFDAQRIRAFRQYIEFARAQFDVPGVAVGIVQNNRIVFAEGFGVRALGEPDKVDAETLFLVASITKPLTTLMLAKLVESGKFRWDTPVTEVLPEFRLGDAETTRRMQIKHLVCACTGLPRQDMEWMFEGENMMPKDIMATLATMQPNSGFGELYQYSNLLAGAAGYVGGHALHPERELGAAYDTAMQSLVFDPLGMTSTTFDYARALRGNHAEPHAEAIDGQITRADIAPNYTNIPSRPDGGAWSNLHDLLRYLQMELHEGKLPSGKRYIAAAPLLARRVQQVSTGKETGYGMGLRIERNLGTTLVSHGGTAFGARAELFWLPEHDVGVVILSNAETGGIRGLIQRRFLELLFDGRPEAEANTPVLAKMLKDGIAAERKLLTVPADPTLATTLATRYTSSALGEIVVERKDGAVWFDFGGWRSEIATRRDEDGTVTFVTVSPSVRGFEFVVADEDGQRALLLRDEQQEYRFDAAK